MSVDADGDRDGEMTLAFALAAIREFEDPVSVFEEAREWSRYVGVVGNDADAVSSFVADHDLRQDFDLGDRDVWLAMEGIRESSDAPRHVFVGTTPEHRRLADATGWEYRRPRDVAEAAGWSLGPGEQAGTGLAGRLRSWISEVLGRRR
ncbi:MAG: hypothetical protein ABEJ40_12070, partial [Haloarculaceae archaeon]